MSERPLVRSVDACVVILGITGDLATWKLLPALFEMWRSGNVSKRSLIVGWGRRSWNDEEFRREVLKILGSVKDVQDFCGQLRYVRGDVSDPGTFALTVRDIGRILAGASRPHMKYLLHIATLPTLYERILRGFRDWHAVLAFPTHPALLIEKPIGMDSTSSKRIDEIARVVFGENSIFRVDHYLMKQALTHMGQIRRRNPPLDAIWNRGGVASIDVVLHEDGPLHGRGELYDSLGVLRDVGQNHVLEILAVGLGEVSGDGRVESGARADVISSLYVSKVSRAVRAQYDGFRRLPGVKTSSGTETFFSITIESHRTRWKGVPIKLSAGKGLSESRVELSARFRTPVEFSFGENGQSRRCDEIKFVIQPNARVEMCMNGGVREHTALAPVCEIASFSELGAEESTTVRDYERAYSEVFSGSRDMFLSANELKAAWKITDAVRSSLEKAPLVIYKVGESASLISTLG